MRQRRSRQSASLPKQVLFEPHALKRSGIEDGASGLRQERFDDFAFDVGQPKIAALESIGEFRVIEAEQVQQSRVEIMHVHLVLNDMKTEFVGFAEDYAGFEAASGHPHDEGLPGSTPYILRVSADSLDTSINSGALDCMR